MANFKSLFFIFLLACMWGPSFLLIKVALTGGVNPILLSTLRVLFASIFLWLFISIKGGVSFPSTVKTWLHLAAMSILSIALPFTLINIAEQHIASALAGIINGITPLATTLLAHYLIHDERLTRNRILGVSLGFIGFLCLLSKSFIEGDHVVDAVNISLVALASLSYAAGIIYGRLFLRQTRTLALPALQVSFAALFLLPLAFFTEGIGSLSHISVHAWISILLLAFWGTACAFVVYFHVLQEYGAIALGSSVFLLPIFSIIFGVVFLHEQLAWFIYLGAGLILMGMKLVHSK